MTGGGGGNKRNGIRGGKLWNSKKTEDEIADPRKERREMEGKLKGKVKKRQ